MASSSSAVTSGPVRGVANDTWADVVIGKPDFTQIQVYRTVQNQLFIPEGVWIDRSRHSLGTQKLYVYDSGNNRILGYNWDACIASTSSPLNCSPSIVLGQANFTSSGCNRDSGFQTYPTRPASSASSLCGLREDQVSVTEGGSGASMVSDSNGALYVTDFWNNRVLKYNDPFGTDTTADAVWGQSDFTGNLCNKSSVGGTPPDASSLCFTWGNNNSWTAGVELDASSNLWVADNGNHRVLRFPKGATTADLVIGQTSLTATDGTTFQDPVALRFSPKTGNLYVADNGANAQRVLRFSPPFSSGMAGTTFATFNSPMGIDVDPAGQGLWITQRGPGTIELWSESGSKLRSVTSSNDSGLSGSVGIDSAGNLASASRYGDNGQNVTAYKTNGTTVAVASVNGNAVDAGSLGKLQGIEVANNQLIAADGSRLLVWNSPGALTSGASASIVDQTPCCVNSLKADSSSHLWTVYGNGGWDFPPFKLVAYALPLGNSLPPLKTIDLTIPLALVGGGTIDLSKEKVLSVAPDGSDSVWIAGGAATSRVVRIRRALTNPVVDVVLGQADPTSTLCNRDHTLAFDDISDIANAKPNTLCAPGSVSVDRYGNVWVADQSIEINGNLRLLEFSAATFAGNPSTPIYGPAAARSYNPSANFEAGFDSNNRLVEGFNPYADNAAYRGKGRFSALYWWPLTETQPSPSTPPQPDLYLSDFESYPYSAAFDGSGNFYAADIDRSRILVYHGLPQPRCQTVPNNGLFQSVTFPTQTGGFTAQFDATPSISPTNGTVGLAGFAPATNPDFSAMIRFNPNGFIDARNGTAFQAAVAIPYAANVKYHFRVVVNVRTQTYSVYVSNGSSAEQALAVNYAFRHSATSLDHLGAWVGATPGGSDTVCGPGITFSSP